MASTPITSPSKIHTDSFASSTTSLATRPFVTQLSSSTTSRSRRPTKQRVLLRVKRRRHVTPVTEATEASAAPSGTAANNADTNQGNPVKKRKIDNTTAPEIIRLSLPTSRHAEEMQLIHRLSSAVSLYGDETTAATAVTNAVSAYQSPPHTPSRLGDEEREEPPSSKTPVKPKRSVVFRKLTDLRKLLHADEDAQHNASRNDDVNDGWDSKGEERSKWLRVVDVKLQDTTSPDEIEGGSGPRLQRMRPRPTSDDTEQRGGKRRKMGLLVENSCTMSQSEFYNTCSNTNTTFSNTNNTCSNTNELDEETKRLIDYSLLTLHNQKGGAISPFLSFLTLDPRLNFKPSTPRGYKMINHKLIGVDGKSRTVLHYAALWGDVQGIRRAVEMGADPEVRDGVGNTPGMLAEFCGNVEVGAALKQGPPRASEAASMANATPNGKEAAKRDEEEDDYYYEVYCLEEDSLQAEAPTQVKVPRTQNSSPNASSFTTSESEVTSPPDLIRMDGHRMSEDEDDFMVELRGGFGYWNERGELVLEAGNENENNGIGSDQSEYEDSGEEASVDYPDEEFEVREAGYNFGNLGSDYDDYFDADDLHNYESDDSDSGWKSDFRNRFVPMSNFNNDESDEEASPGFGTNHRNRMHGWEYGGMGDEDGESDDEYVGPMLG